MATGSVKWFNTIKGFGFIVPDTGGADVFCHVKELRRGGIERLDEKQPVTFEIAPGKDGKPKAINVALVR